LHGNAIQSRISGTDDGSSSQSQPPLSRALVYKDGKKRPDPHRPSNRNAQMTNKLVCDV
jgi:hypothetical protein